MLVMHLELAFARQVRAVRIVGILRQLASTRLRSGKASGWWPAWRGMAAPGQAYESVRLDPLSAAVEAEAFQAA